MSPLAWIHIIVGTIVITIATIIYIKDEKRKETQMDKVLEALEEIKTLRGFNQVELNNDENVNKSLNIIEQALNKAQKEHKALEEQIGCPLEVIVEAQINGFYGKTKEEEFYFYNPVENFIVIDFRLGRIQVALSRDFYNVITFYLSDYKKTWWLREDKSK